MNEHGLLKEEKSIAHSPSQHDSPHAHSPPLFSISWISPILLFLLSFGSLSILPRFEKIFAEFGPDLPLLTKIILDLRLSYALLALSVVSFFLIIRTKYRSFASLTLMVVVAYIISLIYALYQPMIQMIDSF